MKELEFLEIINKTLTKNSHLGDDCAYLTDLGIVVTQDSMVESIHFSTEYSTPYELGYKSIIVNISDILASGAVPKYITVSLSLPKDINKTFVSEFYKACDDLSKQFDIEVIGGDITGSEKIFISVCAIGVTKSRNISSRSNAKVGDYVVTTGEHGSSAAGLWLLQNGIDTYQNLCKSHLMPDIKSNFSNEIATKTEVAYAMMDTSDGLADAVFKIAQAGNVQICIDFDKVPYDKDIKTVAKLANVDYKDWILYGGEDFKLVACVDEENICKLDKNLYTIIGRVKEKNENCFVEVAFKDKIEKIYDLEKTYNHFENKSFGGKNEN